MTDAACDPTRAAAAARWRARCAVFAATLTLAVVLAFAGVPAGAFGRAAEVPVACVAGAARVAACLEAAEGGGCVVAQPLAEPDAPPRPAPRIRRTDTGGLPPTRAP